MKTTYFPYLAAASAIVVSVSPAQAESYRYYVYVGGTPTDVTANIVQTGGHVFLNSVWIGTINSSGQIIGAENELVGFLVLDPEGGLTKKKG